MGECVGWREGNGRVCWVEGGDGRVCRVEGEGRESVSGMGCFSSPQALESVQSLQEAQLRLGELEKQAQGAQQALQNKTEECEKERQVLRR